MSADAAPTDLHDAQDDLNAPDQGAEWRIAPLPTTLEVGQEIELSAQRSSRLGWQQLPQAQLEWRVEPAQLARLNGATLTAQQQGTLQIHAQYQGQRQSTQLRITDSSRELQLNPSALWMETNAQGAFEVSPAEHGALTWRIVESNASASIDDQGHLQSAGPEDLTVEVCDEQACAQAQVHVRILDRFKLIPETALIRVGDKLPLQVIGLDAESNPLSYLSAPPHIEIKPPGSAMLHPGPQLEPQEPGMITLELQRLGRPETLSAFTYEARLRFVKLSCSSQNCCGIDQRGVSYCWGSAHQGWLGNPTSGDTTIPVKLSGQHDIDAFFMGPYVSCATDKQAQSWCWGANELGELGDGSTSFKSEPTRQAGGINFVQLAVGFGSTCGLDPAGALYCWGVEIFGYYDTYRPPTSPITTYTQPRLISTGPFKQLEMDCSMACVEDLNAQWWCMGRGDGGHLGNGLLEDSETLQKVEHPVPLTTVAAGCFGACGLDEQGHVWCWGTNRTLNLGVPNPVPGQRIIEPKPIRTAWSMRFATLETGAGEHYCGRSLDDGKTYCWGNNLQCQLGRPEHVLRESDVPVQVPLTAETSAILDFEVGAWFVCGLHPDGDVYCWGSDWANAVPPVNYPACNAKPFRIRTFPD